MTGRYKAYPEYKDSGADCWFDQVPNHWQVKRISYVAQLKSGDSIVSEQIEAVGDYPVYGGNGHRGYTKKFNHDGDYILIGRQGALCGNINYGYGKFWASEHAVVVHPILDVNFKWLGETLRAMDLNQYNVSAAQPGLAVANITCLKVPYPSIDEQVKIANFLDHETAKIDTLITKQEQLIELLKEKRQAVISHAVTKGLNPDAPMKDSGVEWLGQVPEHWSVGQLKHYVSTVNGFGFSSTDFRDEGVPFVRAGNIKNKTITTPDICLPQDVVDQYKRVILNEDDIVISMVGSDPKIINSAVGQVGIIPKSLAGAVPNQNVVILREKNLIIKKFLFYVLCGTPYRQHLDVFSHKLANQSIISSSLIITASFSFPEAKEQKEVISFLDQRLNKMDTVIAKSISSIELMKERKTALISAAVTGKIDVRHPASHSAGSDTVETSV